MAALKLAAKAKPSRPEAEQAKAEEDNDAPGNKVNIGGDVGQSVAADASFTALVGFTVGKKKPKPY